VTVRAAGEEDCSHGIDISSPCPCIRRKRRAFYKEWNSSFGTKIRKGEVVLHAKEEHGNKGSIGESHVGSVSTGGK